MASQAGTSAVYPGHSAAPRRGLVLAGGAALGAYQAGVLGPIKAAGITFDIIAAASIGCLHAAAWNRGDMVYELGDHWRENVRRLNPFDPRRLLEGKNPFRFDRGMQGVIRRYRGDHPDPTSRGQVPILLSITEADTGKNLFVNASDPQWSQAERAAWLRAAAAIPALGDGPIKIRGRRYYDGGFSNNLPVDPLLDPELELDELWIIPLFPLPSRARWKGPLARGLELARQRLQNPWLLGACGLGRQILAPTDWSDFPGRVVVIRPPGLGAARHLRPTQAFRFSMRHIERLLALGEADARRALDRYHSRGRNLE